MPSTTILQDVIIGWHQLMYFSYQLNLMVSLMSLFIAPIGLIWFYLNAPWFGLLHLIWIILIAMSYGQTNKFMNIDHKRD